MDLNKAPRLPKQPPAGYQLLETGQSVQSTDICRSPITDTWAEVNNATCGHVVSRINAQSNIFARKL